MARSRECGAHLSLGPLLGRDGGVDERAGDLPGDELDADDGVGHDHDQHRQEVHHDALYGVVHDLERIKGKKYDAVCE